MTQLEQITLVSELEQVRAIGHSGKTERYLSSALVISYIYIPPDENTCRNVIVVFFLLLVVVVFLSLSLTLSLSLVDCLLSMSTFS